MTVMGITPTSVGLNWTGYVKYPPRLEYTRSLAKDLGSKKISGSHRSGGTSVMASTLLTILCQKVSRSGAPGRTHAIPMIATSPRTTMSLKCSCPSGELIRLPRLGVVLHVCQAVQGFTADAFRVFDQPQQLSSVSIERDIAMNNVACRIRFDQHLTTDPLPREGSKSLVGLHTGGQGCHIPLHSGPDDDQLQCTIQNHRVDNPGALCVSSETPLRSGRHQVSCNPIGPNPLDLADPRHEWSVKKPLPVHFFQRKRQRHDIVEGKVIAARR